MPHLFKRTLLRFPIVYQPPFLLTFRCVPHLIMGSVLPFFFRFWQACYRWLRRVVQGFGRKVFSERSERLGKVFAPEVAANAEPMALHGVAETSA